jgi:Mn-dependent DtxR family transcriptional regulator
VDDPGAKRDLDDDDVAEIDVRLQRMDAGRPRPWTRAVLRFLAESPGTRSAELSEQLGIDQGRLKSDIRRLKRLGLTRSLERGYELSPRGQAYLDH